MKWTLAAHGMVASGPSLGPGQPYPDVSWHEKVGHHATWPMFKLAYLPNASLNHVYADLKTTVALSRLPADQLQAHAAQALQEHQQSLHGDGLLPFRLRNFWGNVLLAMSGTDLYLSYIERAHDVEGYRRLLRLQLEALKDGIAPAQMPAWLATQAPALRNPYTLAPMGWEPTTQSLVFAGRQPQTQNPGRSSTYRVRVFSAGTPFPRVSR